MYINIYKCIINLINFVTATISFVPNVAGDLPDLQAPPQPCSIKNKTDKPFFFINNPFLTLALKIVLSFSKKLPQKIV